MNGHWDKEKQMGDGREVAFISHALSHPPRIVCVCMFSVCARSMCFFHILPVSSVSLCSAPFILSRFINHLWPFFSGYTCRNISKGTVMKIGGMEKGLVDAYEGCSIGQKFVRPPVRKDFLEIKMNTSECECVCTQPSTESV